MRLPRVRFTVRRLTLAIAFALVGLGSAFGFVSTSDSVPFCLVNLGLILILWSDPPAPAAQITGQPDAGTPRLFQITTRELAILVFLCAALAWGARLLAGHPHRSKASLYGLGEQFWREMSERARRGVGRTDPATSPEGRAESAAHLQKCIALAEYYGRLRVKYERAARQPWRAVEADPPPP